MQSLSGPVHIDTPHRGPKTAPPGNAVATLLAAIALLACLSACSLVDPKPDAGGGQVDAHGSTAGQHPDDSGPETAADQQGLEAIVARLVDDQKEYEARLLALDLSRLTPGRFRLNVEITTAKGERCSASTCDGR